MQDLLSESFTQSFDLDNSELLPVDADDAFGTLRRTKGAGLLERGIAHWPLAEASGTIPCTMNQRTKVAGGRFEVRSVVKSVVFGFLILI